MGHFLVKVVQVPFQSASESEESDCSLPRREVLARSFKLQPVLQLLEMPARNVFAFEDMRPRSYSRQNQSFRSYLSTSTTLPHSKATHNEEAFSSEAEAAAAASKIRPSMRLRFLILLAI